MLNLKKWMAKVGDSIHTVKNGLDGTVIKNIYYANQTGTKTYTLESGYVYLVVAGRINTSSPRGGLYIVTPHSSAGNIVSVVSSASVALSLSSTTLTVTLNDNYVHLSLIKLGGGNILFTPLNRIAQILRRKEVGVC